MGVPTRYPLVPMTIRQQPQAQHQHGLGEVVLVVYGARGARRSGYDVNGASQQVMLATQPGLSVPLREAGSGLWSFRSVASCPKCRPENDTPKADQVPGDACR
jgi:hypothetical protein